MPEPSEIDLLQDKVQNPLQLIENYKKENGIQTDDSMTLMLHNMFEGIKPVINKSIGGNEYKNELLDAIMQVCNINRKDIHINDVYKNTEEYVELIGRI